MRLFMQVKGGETVYEEGDIADELSFVYRGKVNVVRLETRLAPGRRLTSRPANTPQMRLVQVDELRTDKKHQTLTVKTVTGMVSAGGLFGDFEYVSHGTRIVRYEALQSCKLYSVSSGQPGMHSWTQRVLLTSMRLLLTLDTQSICQLSYARLQGAIEEHPAAGKRFVSALKERRDLFVAQLVRHKQFRCGRVWAWAARGALRWHLGLKASPRTHHAHPAHPAHPAHASPCSRAPGNKIVVKDSAPDMGSPRLGMYGFGGSLPTPRAETFPPSLSERWEGSDVSFSRKDFIPPPRRPIPDQIADGGYVWGLA